MRPLAPSRPQEPSHAAEVAGIGEPCLGEGRYTWVLEGDQLTMVAVDDSCTVGRVADWESGWTKMDAI